jgi:hypothetical protein
MHRQSNWLEVKVSEIIKIYKSRQRENFHAMGSNVDKVERKKHS